MLKRMPFQHLFLLLQIMISSLMPTALLLTGAAGAPSTPLKFLTNRQTNISPVINANFPDPSILQDGDTWYAFGTNSGGHNVQVATAPAVGGPYTVLDQDLLPKVGSWSDGLNVWAPDIRKIGNTYVLYYTAESSQDAPHHCVGTATSATIEGPYTPASTPLACPLDQGGAIDPSGFTDTDGKHYVVYKIDGNSIGHGGNCNNAVAPIVPTPIMLQQVASDGFTPVGDPIQILDRDDADGPLVEAPDLILVNGVYVLFFSSNCFDSTLYDIS
jgi:beta-xylosidase